MHYHLELWVEDDNEELIEATLDDKIEVIGFDWYQIGGRWKGAHVPGYKQSEDPNNFESCRHCNGKGATTDVPCIYCKGAGKEMKWPTDWKSHPKDIMPVTELPDDLDAAAVLVGDNFEECCFGVSINVKQRLAELGVDDYGYMVTVDYHV